MRRLKFKPSRASFVLVIVLSLRSLFAEDGLLVQGQGYSADRYAILWTKSPFAVASNDADTTATMSDYELAGVAQAGGVCYASLIEKRTQVHLLLSSDKSAGSLELVSISRSSAGMPTALVRDNGKLLRLNIDKTLTSSTAASPAAASTSSPASVTLDTSGYSTFAPGTMPSRRPFGQMGDAAR
jgi:hypothetical protein